MLVFGCGIYPRPWAALRAFGITLVWAAIAGIGDLVTGGNYMYLRAKPVHNSLLNLMGPWPWYIATTAALALAILLALQIIADQVRRLDREATPAGSAARTRRPDGDVERQWPAPPVGASSAGDDKRLQRHSMK
jgi:hypothetical protein